MKIAYIRPYTGEIDIMVSSAPEYEWVTAESVSELDPATREEVTVLSVFVDYQVTKEVLEELPNLKLIAARSAGYDHIDIAAASEKGVVVSHVPQYGSRTVAEYAVALMFALSRNIVTAYTDMKHTAGTKNLEVYEGFDLSNKTLGVIGTGAIGRSVCSIAQGIGMRVLAYDIAPDETVATQFGFHYCSLEEVLLQSDIVTVHVPSLPATKHLINEEKLRLMKPGSYLINTARGDIVDTRALVEVLHEGHLAGAGLDVLEGEHALREEAELIAAGPVDAAMWATLVADHALIDMPHVIVTPHIAFNTVEAKREITDITIANIKTFVAGQPQNLITG